MGQLCRIELHKVSLLSLRGASEHWRTAVHGPRWEGDRCKFGGVYSITVKISRYPETTRGELLVILLPVLVAQESGCSGFESSEISQPEVTRQQNFIEVAHGPRAWARYR